MSPNRENGVYVTKSVEEVRKLATSTMSLVDSLEVREEVKNIAAACRTFMRDYHEGNDPRVLRGCLSAMRAEVGQSAAFLVKVLDLQPPTRFDVQPYEKRALDILEGWLSDPV